MKVVTAEEMREIDRRTIGGYGIPGAVLMERAGLAVAARVQELYSQRKVIVLAGSGNNGGDGLVAGRELFNRGWHVRVFMLAKDDKLSPDCLAQFRIVKKMGLPIEFRTRIERQDLHSAVVIDAILGTGLDKPVRQPISDIVRFLNSSSVPVVSVDIPSGISSDNGCIMGEAVMADATVTFGLPKIGHYLHPGAGNAGRLFIEDIGFPREFTFSEKLLSAVLGREDAAQLIPDRPADSHKGNYGHLLLIAGSYGKPGAALMAAKACLRAGAGLVTIGVPESMAETFESRVTEEMVLPLPDHGTGMLSSEAVAEITSFINERADVLAIGPGIGVSEETRSLLSRLVLVSTVPMVIDADGVNSLAGQSDILKKAKSPLILTPHSGEMERLLGMETHVVTEDPVSISREFTARTGAYLVLKGAPTIVAAPEGNLFINTTGNPGMATGGSGDVLTGMIAGLLGQEMNPLDASLLGVYLHGLAGDIAASEKGMHSLIAGDIIGAIPDAFLALGQSDEETHPS